MIIRLPASIGKRPEQISKLSDYRLADATWDKELNRIALYCIDICG
ncbi:MAG: hypothetical protein AB8B64_04840 [Granulosicoccus sp.]